MAHEGLQGLDYIAQKTVPLDGIEPLRFGEGEENTFVGSFRRLLKVIGMDVPYWYLMSVCGAAFRLQIHRDSWRMNSPDIIAGMDLTPPLFKAFGLTCEREWVCSDPERIKRAKARIVENLQRGWPSVGLSMDGKAYHGLIIGHTSRETLLALDYSIPGMPHAVAEKLVWCYHLATSLKAPMEKPRQVAQAFALARELVGARRSKTFHLGLDAYDYWYNTLTNPAHHDPYEDDWRARERNDGNYWIYVNLLDARKCAAKFCAEMADEFARLAEPLGSLASLYSAMTAKLQPLLDRRLIRPGREIHRARPWTNYDRRKQALCLMEVKALEERTIPLLGELKIEN